MADTQPPKPNRWRLEEPRSSPNSSPLDFLIIRAKQGEPRDALRKHLIEWLIGHDIDVATFGIEVHLDTAYRNAKRYR